MLMSEERIPLLEFCEHELPLSTLKLLVLSSLVPPGLCKESDLAGNSMNIFRLQDCLGCRSKTQDDPSCVLHNIRPSEHTPLTHQCKVML